MGQNVTLVPVLFLFYTHLPVRSGGDNPIGCFRHILFDNEAERVKNGRQMQEGKALRNFGGQSDMSKKKGAQCSLSVVLHEKSVQYSVSKSRKGFPYASFALRICRIETVMTSMSKAPPRLSQIFASVKPAMI